MEDIAGMISRSSPFKDSRSSLPGFVRTTLWKFAGGACVEERICISSDLERKELKRSENEYYRSVIGIQLTKINNLFIVDVYISLLPYLILIMT